MKQSQIFEDFDNQYIFLQIVAHKKWIVISTLLFLLGGLGILFSSAETWSSQIKIQGLSQIDQKSVFIFNREIYTLKYGKTQINSDHILNEFISFIDGKSDSIKIRKELNKSYLIQSFASSPSEADRKVSDFLKTQNELFLNDFRNQMALTIDKKLSDAQLVLNVKDQILTERQAYVFELYFTWLNFFKQSSQFYNEPDLFVKDFNPFKPLPFLKQENYRAEKYAILNSKYYLDQEIESMKAALLQAQQLIQQPVKGQVFHIAEHRKALEAGKSPKWPLVLILSTILGFSVGLFGVIFYISSIPLFDKK